MSARHELVDVVVAAAAVDRPLEKRIARFLAEAGFSVFGVPSQVGLGSPVPDLVRKTIAESRAVIVLLSAASAPNPSLAWEVGLAMGWGKPVLVVLDDSEPVEVPDYLAAFRSVRLSQIEQAVEWLRGIDAPLSKQEVSALERAYAAIGMAIDQLVSRPDKLDALAFEVQRHSKRAIAPERLLQEMLRRRKEGKWPRLGLVGKRRSGIRRVATTRQ